MHREQSSETLPEIIENNYALEADIFFNNMQALNCAQVEVLASDEAYLRAEHHYGDRMTVLAQEKNDTSQEIHRLEKRVQILEQQKAKTPKRKLRPKKKVRSLTENNPDMHSTWHTGWIILVCVALATTLGIGFANVFSNLMASGEPVFLNNPVLAVFIALLMPVACMALKSLSLCFESEKAKKHFRSLVFSLTVISIIGWSFSFAQHFTGIASSIDFQSLGEESGKGSSVLVWLQLVSEVLVSVSLGLVLEHLLDQRIEKEWVDNPDYFQLVADLNPLISKLEKLKKQRRQIRVQQQAAQRGYDAIIHLYRRQYALWLNRTAAPLRD